VFFLRTSEAVFMIILQSRSSSEQHGGSSRALQDCLADLVLVPNEFGNVSTYPHFSLTFIVICIHVRTPGPFVLACGFEGKDRA
jgi:hypothetical protein